MLVNYCEDFDVYKERYVEVLTQIFKGDMEITTVAQIKRLSARKLSRYHKLMVQKIKPDETQVAFRRKLFHIIGQPPKSMFDEDKIRSIVSYLDETINWSEIDFDFGISRKYQNHC